MINANILHDCYSMTTTKETYKISFDAQSILSIERRIKYTHCLMDLKMNLDYKGVKILNLDYIFRGLKSNRREEDTMIENNYF